MRHSAEWRLGHSLFGGSDAGEERAGIYSPVGSAELNDVDPGIHLQRVFERIAYHLITQIAGL
jgi:hypothetical protein